MEVTSPEGTRELVITRANDGHFHVDGEANGASVRFLVDTGASGTVLTMDDAARARHRCRCAGLQSAGADRERRRLLCRRHARQPVDRSVQRFPVPVGVMPNSAMDTSLLGMSTIDRFSSWRVEGDQMVLVP